MQNAGSGFPGRRMCAALAIALSLNVATADDATTTSPAAEAAPVADASAAKDAAGDPALSTAGETPEYLMTIAATRNERNKDLTPGEVSVVEGKDLEDRHANDLRGVLMYEPGVEVQGSARSAAQKPTIRGLSDERVLVNVDDTPLLFDSGHKGQVFVDDAFIKRVEVVRGPSSVLYGSNAIGGMVSMETLDPDDLIGASDIFGIKQRLSLQGINQEYASTTILAGRLARTGPGSQLEYLLGFTGRDAQQNLEVGGGNSIPYSEEDVLSGLAKLVWWATPEDRLEASYSSYLMEGLTPANADSVATTGITDRDTHQQQFRLNYSRADEDATWFDPNITLYYNDMAIREDGKVGTTNKDRIDYTSLGVKAENVSRLEGEHHGVRFTYGAEYRRDEQDATRNGGYSGFFPPATADNYGVFGQAEIALWDELLTIIPGVRADRYVLNAEGQETVEEDNLSKKLGIALKLDDELNMNEGDYVVLHANYAEGFRTPSFGELYPTGVHFAIPFFGTAFFQPNPDLKPETSQTMEGGARIKLGGFRAGATYFETKAQDFIVLDWVPGGGAYPLGNYQARNVADAKLHGVELEAEYSFLDSWRVWGNFTHTVGDDEGTNKPLSGVSPDAFKLGVDWYDTARGVTVGLRTRIYDDYTRLAPNETAKNGFQLYDFVAAWEPTGDFVPGPLKGIGVGFSVENLTDEHYTWSNGSPGHGINPVVSVSYTRTW